MAEKATPYNKMKKLDLAALLRSRNLSTEGSKTNMVARLYREDAEMEAKQKASTTHAAVEVDWGERQQAASTLSEGYSQVRDDSSEIIYNNDRFASVIHTPSPFYVNHSDSELITIRRSTSSTFERKKKANLHRTSSKSVELNNSVEGTQTASKRRKNVHRNGKSATSKPLQPSATSTVNAADNESFEGWTKKGSFTIGNQDATRSVTRTYPNLPTVLRKKSNFWRDSIWNLSIVTIVVLVVVILVWMALPWK